MLGQLRLLEMYKFFALSALILLPSLAMAEEIKPAPTYGECFKLLREQIQKDALAQKEYSKNPLAIPADLGADATTRRLNKKTATDDFILEVEPAGGIGLEFTPLPLDEKAKTEPTPAEQCKAMYFLTY